MRVGKSTSLAQNYLHTIIIIYSNSVKIVLDLLGHCIQSLPDDCLDDHEPSVYESGLSDEEF